ncbi:MAG TPA: response regulator [Bacteroidota bacterium]|nr:response regulator [Bacteroidota bacterium]
MIIEDEPLINWSIESALKKVGFDVVIVTSVENAINQLRSERFDLVITDFQFPQIDGFEVAKIAKRITPEIKVIMISTDNDFMNRHEYESTEIEQFIEKPFDLNELVRVIKESISKGR